MTQNLPSEMDVFKFLDDLRGSGVTNMFGATPWIMENFHITKYDANRFLVKWMETFSFFSIGNSVKFYCDIQRCAS